MTRNSSTPPVDQSSTPTVPVVAIGASAGGLEAVSNLIANLSITTGLAFIYIQHPDDLVPGAGQSDSSAVTALSHATSMPVVEAKDQMSVQPNQVYVIATLAPITRHDQPAGNLEIIDGVFTFVARRQDSLPVGDMPIDRFFLSLAEHQRSGAVAVLLSGKAVDGTLGMRAIRAAGGLTFAQDETAQFQSMPNSAIVEGVVDQILSPVGIANELNQLSQHLTQFQQAAGADGLERGYTDPDEWADQSDSVVAEGERVDGTIAPDQDLARPSDPAVDLSTQDPATEADLRTIIQLVRRAVGTDFSHYKMTTIRRRIIRRMLLFRLETLYDYANYLRNYPDEIRALYDDLLINVTTFFRDTDTMDYLQRVLLPQLVENKLTSEPLRIWVPACSTGQEAYSIAMLLLEVLGERASSLTIQLFATDLSQSAVTKARLGSYTRGEVMDVSPRRLQRFFTKVDDHYRINKTVRDLCVFAPHNLLKDPPFSRLNFISCRNLLIYLDNQLQSKVIATFHYALNPSGVLLLGRSETVGQSSLFFSPVETNHKLYARKNDRSDSNRSGLPVGAATNRALFDMTIRSEALRPQPDANAPAPSNEVNGADALPRSSTSLNFRKPKTARPANDLDRAVDDLLLSQYVPASVVVNTDLDILQFRGSTGLFLEPAPGRASLNLLKMARPSLAFELRNIAYKAGQSGQAVRRSGLEIKLKDQVHYVSIEAVPFSTDTDERLLLILFEEVPAVVIADNDATDFRTHRIKQLEDELATLRDDMRSVIEEQEVAHEELQSANEEIISSNEELQSINEEIETSKEEIESTNEELLTINQELQVRNDQLSEAYAFAEAIFGTISEATLVLTPDLRIKSANPVFYTLFGLTEEETEGRLIYELASRQWDIPQLRTMLTDVATRDEQVQGFELTYQFPEIGEKVLSLNARRVVRQQEAILLAIADITEHRRAQRFLEEREAWFHQIADNAPALIWVAGPDGRYTFINSVWLEYTGRSLPDVLTTGWGQTLHPDDQADYEKTYQTNLLLRQSFQTEYRLRRYDGDYHWMLENVQPTFAPDGQFTGFIGTAADVQEQKELTAKLDRLVADRTQELQQTNARLKQSAEALQTVLDSSAASIGLLKAIRTPSGDITDLNVVVANQRFAQLVGSPLDKLPQLCVEQLAQVLGQNELLARLVQVIETGEPLYTELSYADKWLALSVIKQDDGVVLMGLDITDLRQMQQQHEALLDQVRQSGETVVQLATLQQQIQTRGELLRSSSHDLRGSLGVIQGAASLLSFADSDEERAQMLDMIQRNVQETIRLITELLDLSRLESGQQQVVFAPFDAAELLRKLGENVRPLVEGKGLTLQLLGNDQLPVEGDAINVLRMVQNIVLNALKYTVQGSITLHWGSADADDWFFSVADTGPGMDPALAHKLAHEALATDSMTGQSTTDPASVLITAPLLGTSVSEGIGLVIVRQLCDLLKGRLMVDSQPNQGSTFRVVLPRRY